MNDATIIHCRCHRGAFSRVLAVLLADGRLEMREAGKSSIVAGGTVELACKRCGYKRELVLARAAALPHIWMDPEHPTAAAQL